MRARDDHRFAGDVHIAFAMYCDAHITDPDEVLALSEETQNAVMDAAETCVDQRRYTWDEQREKPLPEDEA